LSASFAGGTAPSSRIILLTIRLFDGGADDADTNPNKPRARRRAKLLAKFFSATASPPGELTTLRLQIH
jgi:hypothetical protein